MGLHTILEVLKNLPLQLQNSQSQNETDNDDRKQILDKIENMNSLLENLNKQFEDMQEREKEENEVIIKFYYSNYNSIAKWSICRDGAK